MEVMTLQKNVATIARNLMKTGEFKDLLEIAKGLLYLDYVSQRYPEVFKEVVKNKTLYSFKSLPRDFWYTTPVDYTVIESEETLGLLIEAFMGLDINSDADRSIFADEVINHLVSVSGKEMCMLVPPKPELAQLIAHTAKTIGMDSVFDPFAAIPTYAATQEFKGISFRGCDISHDAATLGNLLLAIHGKKMSIEKVNYLHNADKIGFSEGLISIPPFNMHIKDMVDSPASANFADEFLIQRFLEDGDSMKAIILLPMRFAFSNGCEWLRSYLLNRDAIDMVISLPQGLLNGTNIPSLMLVLDREKPEERDGKITFMSLLDCIVSDKKNSVTIDLEKAKHKISYRTGKYVVTEHVECIDGIHHDINPGKFLTKNCVPDISKSAHIAPLYALLYPVKKETKRVKLGETQSVVGLTDLSSEYKFLSLSETPESKTTTKYFEIQENAIVIGATSNSFKVGRFLYNGYSLAISDRLAAFKLDSVGEIDYILLEMTKSYISEQIKILNRRMPFEDLDYLIHNIYIICEDIENQQRTIKKAKDAYVALLHEDISSIQDDFRRDVHMKRHAIGQTIASIGSWWTLLEQVRAKGTSIDEKTMLEGLDITVGNVLDNIRTCFARLSTQIDKFDRGYNSKSEIFDLNKFCEGYISSHQSPIFEYKYLEAYSLEDCPRVCSIFFPPEVLTIILNNIISNACSHGFNNQPKQGNVVSLIILELDGGYELIVSNNGEPCAPGMTPDKMVLYGESTDLKNHCGIGGYEIKQLMKDFGGELAIVLNSEAEFPVQYRLTFNSVEDGNNK